MKKKILFMLAGLAFAAMMTFNFNQSQPDAMASTTPVNLWGLNSAVAQPENCPCSSSNCQCIYKIIACPNGGSYCGNVGNQCSPKTGCTGG